MKWIFIILFIVSSAPAVWLSYCTNDSATMFGSNMLYGVRFTPPSNSGFIAWVSTYCLAYGMQDSAPFSLWLYHVVNSHPTTAITSRNYYTTSFGDWKPYYFAYQWNGGSETEFLLAFESKRIYLQPPLYYTDSLVGVDTQLNPPNRNWSKPASAGEWQLNTQVGDFMIRVEICCVGVSPASVGMIKSLFSRD